MIYKIVLYEQKRHAYMRYRTLNELPHYSIVCLAFKLLKDLLFYNVSDKPFKYLKQLPKPCYIQLTFFNGFTVHIQWNCKCNNATNCDSYYVWNAFVEHKLTFFDEPNVSSLIAMAYKWHRKSAVKGYVKQRRSIKVDRYVKNLRQTIFIFFSPRNCDSVFHIKYQVPVLYLM